MVIRYEDQKNRQTKNEKKSLLYNKTILRITLVVSSDDDSSRKTVFWEGVPGDTKDCLTFKFFFFRDFSSFSLLSVRFSRGIPGVLHTHTF